MPIYDYCCEACEYVFELNKKIVDCDAPTLEPCPSCNTPNTVKKLVSAPGICDPVRLGVKKAPADFQKYVLGRIKEAHPRGTGLERSRSITREI